MQLPGAAAQTPTTCLHKPTLPPAWRFCLAELSGAATVMLVPLANAVAAANSIAYGPAGQVADAAAELLAELQQRFLAGADLLASAVRNQACSAINCVYVARAKPACDCTEDDLVLGIVGSRGHACLPDAFCISPNDVPRPLTCALTPGQRAARRLWQGAQIGRGQACNAGGGPGRRRRSGASGDGAAGRSVAGCPSAAAKR